TAFLKLSNTLADIQYEIQSTTDLLQTNWTSEGFLFGDQLTNWTPTTALRAGRTNLFFRIRSWQDDGSGLPIWWQEQNFGTNNVDPYGDPDADGWSNLQELQNGTGPNTYDTPPQPTGLTVNYNSGNNSALITWSPSPGPVLSYTLQTPNGTYTLS